MVKPFPPPPLPFPAVRLPGWQSHISPRLISMAMMKPKKHKWKLKAEIALGFNLSQHKHKKTPGTSKRERDEQVGGVEKSFRVDVSLITRDLASAISSETDIQEKEQKESQKQAIPSTE
ncbi:hypothetical protein Tco_0549672 [Tanacetum coccineum]